MAGDSPRGRRLPHDTSSLDGLGAQTTITVRFCETDLVGIVHHSNYLVYFEAGRVDWLRQRGIRYEDWAKRGIHFPVVEARVRYKKPARFGDTLVIATSCITVTRATVRFGYIVTRHARSDAVAAG